MALRIELTARQLDDPLFYDIPGQIVHGAGCSKVPELDVIGSLVDINPLNGFRDDEVQIRIALAMRMGAQVDRHAIGEQGEVRSMVRVEPAQEILVGLARATGMFDRDEARHQTQQVGRPALWLEQDLLVRDELL